ncbi:hypothetical protein ACS3SW_06305 [Roseobacteraceae bacterium S113]
MTYLKASLVCLLALGSTGLAAAPLSGDAFERYVQGQTLYFGSEGIEYGAEEYLENRRVRWSFLDGKCKEGIWYEAPGSQICFVYEDRPDEAQCWVFETTAGGLTATFQGPSERVLYEARRSEEPMLCLGPEVGV